MRRAFGRKIVALFTASVLAILLQPTALASTEPAKNSIIHDAGYYETSVTLTKRVGDVYHPKTSVDGTASWISDDPSIARVDGYTDSGASISFLKEGVTTVTFRNTYTYIKPVFVQTGTVTGIWYPQRCTGMTVVHFVITVKEAIGTSLFAGGNGTSASPYLISTKTQLANINKNPNTSYCYYKLVNNITFSPEDFNPGGEFYNDGCGWFPIGTIFANKDKTQGTAFNDEFDGNGYVISGLYSKYFLTEEGGTGYFGLFGVNTGTIKNLGVENSTFIAYSAAATDTTYLEYVGGIAGSNGTHIGPLGGMHGFIYNCYVANCLIGGNSAGGIVGNQEGFLYDCYSYKNSFAVIVANAENAKKGFVFGGIAGDVDTRYVGQSRTIWDCYTADLSFCGWSNIIDKTKNHCGTIAGYLIANTIIDDCYYNNTDAPAFYYRSGTTYAYKRTTDEMQKQGNFYGLNFSNTWMIDSTAAYKYPTLKVFHTFQEALYVSAPPNKTMYMVGSTLDLTGGKVSYTNSDGKTYSYAMTDDLFSSTPDPSPTSLKGKISSVDLSTPGEKTVTIEYMGQTAEFHIFVVDAKLASTLKISCPDVTAGTALAPKVTQNDSQAAVTYKYYADANCTQAIAKPSAAGTYYVKAFTPETDVYQAASSDANKFSILPQRFTVSFNSQSGTAVASQSIAVNGLVAKPANPTRTGYTFGGWYKQAACTTAWNFATDKVTAATTIWAKWMLHVTFNSQGGTAVASQTVAVNGLVAKPANPTRTGYTFGGWYKQAACTTAWNFATDKVTAATTIWAKWTINIYTVTFNSQGGATVASKTAQYGATIPAPASPTRTGCNFVGWFTAATRGTKITFPYQVKNSVTMYAHWSVRAPANLCAISATNNSIKLTWTAASGVTGYSVVRSLSSSFSSPVTLPVPAGASTYTDTGLKPGTTYYYKVCAYVGTTKKAYSAYTTAIGTAVSTSYTSARLTWGAVAGTAYYEVSRATTAAGAYTILGKPTACTFIDSKATTGSTYYYRVRAYNSTTKAFGPYRSIGSITIVPAIPSRVSAARVSPTSVKVAWAAVVGASGYEISRAASATGVFNVITSVTTTSYTNINLKTGTTYYYKVRAYKSVGGAKVYGLPSVVVNAKP